MKYCPLSTRSHPFYVRYSSEVLTIKESIIKEGGKGNLFNDDQVIDLDGCEIIAAQKERRSNLSTMDVFFGVSNYKKDNNGRLIRDKSGHAVRVNPKLQLVDYKFNHNSALSIRKEEIEKKISDSIAILSQDIGFTGVFYFIFKDGVINQAKNYFNRLYATKKSRIPITESEFHNIFWE